MSQVSRIGSHAGKGRADGDREAQASLVDQRLQLTRDVQHERSKHERFGVHLESPGGDLRDVEHLVHEMSQVCGRRRDAVDGRNLARRQIAVHTVLEQLDETNDRVERRSQLVRDIGEKLALRRVGARHFAVQSLELRGTFGDANRQTTFADHAKSEKCDGGETQRPEDEPKGGNTPTMGDDESPRHGRRNVEPHDVPEILSERGGIAVDEDGVRSSENRRGGALRRPVHHKDTKRRVVRQFDRGRPRVKGDTHGLCDRELGLPRVGTRLRLCGLPERLIASQQAADHEQERCAEHQRKAT